MYIYRHTSICTSIYPHTRIYINMFIHVNMCIYIYTHIFIFTSITIIVQMCVCDCMYINLYICTALRSQRWVRMQLRTYFRVWSSTHARISMFTRVNKPSFKHTWNCKPCARKGIHLLSMLKPALWKHLGNFV